MALAVNGPPPGYVPCPNNCGRWYPHLVQVMCWACWDAFKLSLDWFRERGREEHPDWQQERPEACA